MYVLAQAAVQRIAHPLFLLHPLPEKQGANLGPEWTTLQEAHAAAAAHPSPRISAATDATTAAQPWADPQTDQRPRKL